MTAALLRSMTAIRFIVLWAAVWTLIVQSTLAFSAASAAVGLSGDSSLSLICHTQDGGEPITFHDPLIKKCPKCITGILGHGLPPPQVNGLRLPALTAGATHAPRRAQTLTPQRPHERPETRGPPANV